MKLESIEKRGMLLALSVAVLSLLAVFPLLSRNASFAGNQCLLRLDRPAFANWVEDRTVADTDGGEKLSSSFSLQESIFAALPIPVKCFQLYTQTFPHSRAVSVLRC